METTWDMTCAELNDIAMGIEGVQKLAEAFRTYGVDDCATNCDAFLTVMQYCMAGILEKVNKMIQESERVEQKLCSIT